MNRTIVVGPASLNVIDTGSGCPCFVFIHGLACDHTAWQLQVDDLSRDYRCVSIDLRGRGGSSLTPPFDTTRQADDVAAAIDELGIGPAIVVGHSLGGTAALLLNERHPDLVLGIVLGDALVRQQGVGAQRLMAALRAAATTEPMRPLVETFWVEETPEAIREGVRELMLGCPFDVAAGMPENAPDDRMKELVQLADRKPFMAIWAERPLGDPAWLRVRPDVTIARYDSFVVAAPTSTHEEPR